MIDTELINKAKRKSNLIEEIDASWREFVRKLKEGLFSIPFEGNYACLVKDESVVNDHVKMYQK